MRAVAGSILILAAVLFHQSPAVSRPVGLCLLWSIMLAGAFYLASDLVGNKCPPYVAALRARLWRWFLDSGNFLIKGTISGAVVGMLAGLVLFGPSKIGSLAAIPGAFVGLVLGVVLDAIAHRQRYSQPPQPAKAVEPIKTSQPFAENVPSRLVESHGWDLSLGVSHTIPDWPRDSNPIERQ